MLREQSPEDKTMNRCIFKAVVGSQAYGTSTPASDTDFKGIFIEDLDKIVGFGYREQITINKDEMYFELRRFIQLAASANPTVLELLFSPEDCIIHRSKEYDILWENRKHFVTKECANSFAGYAIQQIKKARGLDKKMNWEKSRVERKTLLDFCFVQYEGGSIQVNKFLEIRNFVQERCGLVKLDHMRDCYLLYYDIDGNLDYHGLCGEASNDVRLSSIPKHLSHFAEPIVFYFNRDGYSQHCKDYREYQEWLTMRNTARYVDSQVHGQKIDGKNLMHCKRLIDMAREIAVTGDLVIRRPNAKELLAIRRGEVSLEKLLEQCEQEVHELDDLFAGTNLPLGVEEKFAHELILEIHGMEKSGSQPTWTHPGGWEEEK